MRKKSEKNNFYILAVIASAFPLAVRGEADAGALLRMWIAAQKSDLHFFSECVCVACGLRHEDHNLRVYASSLTTLYL